MSFASAPLLALLAFPEFIDFVTTASNINGGEIMEHLLNVQSSRKK